MAIIAAAPDPKGVAAALALMGGGGTTTGGPGKVFMGTTSPASGPHGGSGSVAPEKEIWMSLNEATGDFYTWGKKRQQDLLSQGVVSGQLPVGSGVIEAAKLWGQLVNEAANYGAAGKKVTPMDLLATYVDAAGGSGKNTWTNMGAFEVNTVTGEKRYAGPGTYLGNGKAQQVDTRTDLTDPDTARAVATKLFQDMMGRDPGEGELSGFANALNAAETNNPVTQTTTTQYSLDNGQAINSDTQSSGGVTAEGRDYIGQQQIKKKKEYGAVQAATTYQNAFENLIYGAPQ